METLVAFEHGKTVIQGEDCTRYGLTRLSKPHSDDVQEVQEYNAAAPPNIDLPGESTHEADSAFTEGSSRMLLALVSTRRHLAPSTRI